MNGQAGRTSARTEGSRSRIEQAGGTKVGEATLGLVGRFFPFYLLRAFSVCVCVCVASYLSRLQLKRASSPPNPLPPLLFIR